MCPNAPRGLVDPLGEDLEGNLETPERVLVLEMRKSINMRLDFRYFSLSSLKLLLKFLNDFENVLGCRHEIVSFR